MWELTRSADLIVVARVGLRPSDDGAGDIAVLYPLQTLKGEAPAVLEVHADSGIICPASPDYRPGHVVVAFLSRENDTWFTTGSSYGTRYATTDRGVDAIASAVKHALRLQRSTSADAPAPHAWSLAATEAPETRWDGLLSLRHETDLRPRCRSTSSTRSR